MEKVYKNIYISDDGECQDGTDDMAVIHACKIPCHQEAVGYTGNLDNTDPDYLFLEEENDLYLNIIDPPIPLFKLETFIEFLKFSKKHYDSGQKIFIHCNQGQSRAPSLALLFMSKCLPIISDKSYKKARMEFKKIYPDYSPGKGIVIFLTKNWNKL